MTLAVEVAVQVVSEQTARVRLVALAEPVCRTRFAQGPLLSTAVAVVEAARVRLVGVVLAAEAQGLHQPQEAQGLRTQVVAGALAEHPVGPVALAAAASWSCAASPRHP